jgi:hypothetical protein
VITDEDRWDRIDDAEERAVEARKERLLEAADRRNAGTARGGLIAAAAGLPAVAPAADLIAGRAEFLTDTAGNPITRAPQTTPTDPRTLALEALMIARDARRRHELHQHPELAFVTFEAAAHQCAGVAARLLLDDAADPRLSLTGHARAFAMAFQLLADRAARARAAWSARPTVVAA